VSDQYPATVARAATTSAFAMATTAHRAFTDYWSGAVTRRADPVGLVTDAVRWWQVASRFDRPQWVTPHSVVAEWPIARLRDFSDDKATDLRPTLLLPPQAGHDSCIVDFAPSQSQVQTVRAAGLTRVYSMDWIGATSATKNAGIEDYIDVLDAAVDHIGGPVNLVGDCQGGWLAVIYAALRAERVHTLTIAGAPIDFHAGDAAIHHWLNFLTPGGELTFYQSTVALNGGVLPGWFLLAGFIALQPENELDRQLQLLSHIDDEAYVGRNRRFENWFKHTQPIPGRFYLWIVRHLFRDNELLQGRLRVADELVDLRRINCPLFLLAGASDHITPPDQVFALESATSTPQSEVFLDTANAGHLGLFMGHQALQENWLPIMQAVRELS
jgi:poly(3-hydroxybutyrate) depolymerase